MNKAVWPISLKDVFIRARNFSKPKGARQDSWIKKNTTKNLNDIHTRDLDDTRTVIKELNCIKKKKKKKNGTYPFYKLGAASEDKRPSRNKIMTLKKKFNYYKATGNERDSAHGEKGFASLKPTGWLPAPKKFSISVLF